MVKVFLHRSILTLISSLLLTTGLWAQETSSTRLIGNTMSLQNCKVFYMDSGGKGIPVVFLHGGYGNSKVWKYQIPAFTKAGYRFVAIDYRSPCSTNPMQGGDNASALINEVTSRLALPKFHLVGTASGGVTALKYALANRDKLRSIIISHSIGNVEDPEYSEINMRIRPAAFNQIPLEIRELGPSYRAANPEGVKNWLSLVNESRDTAPTTKDNPNGMGSKPGEHGNDMGAGRNAPDAATWSNLDSFKLPILMMTGDADLYTPPSVMRIFTSHVKRAESAIIPESGHSSFWENPDIFNRTVLAFISKY